jgi:hypothetical protein
VPFGAWEICSQLLTRALSPAMVRRRMSTLAQTNNLGSANVEVCFQLNRPGARRSLTALQD